MKLTRDKLLSSFAFEFNLRRYITAKHGAVLSFADGTIMMMAECYQETTGKNRAMAAGKLMLSRTQCRESFIGTKIKGVMSKIDYMVFGSEEDAEERELFLTEQNEERPLDELEGAGGGGGARAEVGPLAGKAWYLVTVCS